MQIINQSKTFIHFPKIVRTSSHRQLPLSLLEPHTAVIETTVLCYFCELRSELTTVVPSPQLQLSAFDQCLLNLLLPFSVPKMVGQQFIYIKLGLMRSNSLFPLLSLLLILTLTHSWCYKSYFTVPGESTTLDISPDSAYMAVTAVPQNAVYVYDILNNNLLLNYTPSAGTVVTARFSRDGVYLGIAANNGANAAITLLSGRSTFNSTTLINFPLTSRNIADIDFNQNSTKLLACYSNGNKYEIFNNYTGVGTASTSSVTIANNIVKCRFSQNDDVGYIDTNKGTKIYRPAGTSSTSITNAAANYKNFDIRQTTATPIKFIAAGSDTKSYYATDTNPGSMTANSYSLTSILSSGVMTSACYSGDSLFYASAGGGTDMRIFIFADNDTLFQVFNEPTLTHLSCRFTPDGSYLYFGTAASSSFSNVYIYKKNCFECPVGYFLTGNNTCTLCNLAVGMLYCSSCVNTTTCTSCFSGYYLNQTNSLCFKCDYIIQGCSTCANATFCYECNSNYLINVVTRQCQTCATNQTGCLACNTTTCLTCMPEYYLSSGVCIRCNNTKLNCLRCSSTGSCVQCMFGFYSSGGNCLSCNANCQFCYNSATNCSACVRGYYVFGLVCTACTADCLDCNSTNYCFDCRMGTYLTAAGTCSACLPPCDTCNSTNCLTCVAGTYLSNTCVSCALNCSSCVTSTNCSACSFGSYLTSANLCLSCRYLFSNCSSCNLTQCFSCDAGCYLSAANTCLACTVSGCIACNSSTLCQTCTIGYYLTSTSNCAQCNQYCDTCQISSTNCSSCIPGYYLSTGSCLSCPNNCQTCNGTICFSCTNSYYLASGSCTACKTAIYGCIDCMNSTYCKGCQVGKYLTAATLCAECPSSCASCNSLQCMSCSLGYYLSSNACYKCADNCSECYSATNCYACNPGFYYNSGAASLQCTSCWSLFRGCLTCNSTVCFNCQFGHYLDSGTKTCFTCKTAIPNCLYCQASTYCQLCSQGYYLNAANNSCTTCVSAIEGCQSCSGSGQCLTCSLGYYLNGNICTACSPKCLTCNSTDCITCAFRYVLNTTSCVSCSSLLPHCDICNTAATCLCCFEGFFLSSGACVACESQLVGCSYCNSSAICTNCMQGFYLAASNTCTLCSTAQGCLLCSSSTVCTDCATGYVLSTSTCVLCSSVLPSCVYCPSSATCVQCAAGYYINGGGTCSSCSSALSQCIYCSSGTQCTNCQGGYYLNGMTCSSCAVTGCETCSTLTPTQCVNCYSGYYISGNSCFSCNSTGCLDCTQANVCLFCQVGFYLSSSACSLCSTAMSGCTKCSSSSVCTECQTLYYLSNSSCVPCSITLVGCAVCTNSSMCLFCNSGYYLNSSALCSLCTSLTGCLLCTDMSTCIYCNSGYYLLAGVCKTCTNIIYCSVCSNANTCTSCISGYFLSSSGVCTVIQSSTGGSSTPISTVTNMKWTSFYVDSSTLKHVLQAVGMTYTKVNTTWSSNVKIAIGNKTSTTALSITSMEWGRPYELIFYTNNPLQFSMKSLPLMQRLLVGQSLQLNMNSSVEVSQSLMAAMLPNLLISNALTKGYNLDDPQFYNSYINSVYSTYYYIIGMAVTGLLFLNYLIKALCTVVHSNNHGSIAGHIFALKAVSISLYPTFGEYINYGYGYMTADFPWLNSWFGYMLSNDSDDTPLGYLLYYSNMNLFSTYTLALAVYLLALGLAFMAFHQQPDSKKFQLKTTKSKEKPSKFSSLSELFLNFFYFGMVFASCASLQGSIINPYNIISINGVGYVLGIILYVITLGLCLNSLQKDWSFILLRLFVKGTLLSIAHYNPIYIFAVAITMDMFLVFIEIKVRFQFIINPFMFLTSQILVNFSLSIFFYLPDSLIAIYLSAAAVALVILIEIDLHYIEHCIPYDEYPIFSKEKVTIGRQDVNWKINPHDYSLENESVANGREKELQLHEENDNIFFNEPEISPKYSTFKETEKKSDPKRRSRRFRDANKTKTTMNSSWTTFQINKK